MEVIDGGWTLTGLEWNDPSCLHSVKEAEKLIEKYGFLPFFKNEIEGFSLEEHTDPTFWWSGDKEKDPWEWRAIIAKNHNILYGKFFNKKAGFISKKFLPDFVNYRRDGYDFDARFDDGKAPLKHKKIMVNFIEDNADNEIMSNVLKEKVGFGKGGEKGYDTAITNLMMQLYLCNSDFKKRTNKNGEEFGWDVAQYTAPEHLFGYDFVTSAYKKEPSESFEAIKKAVLKHFPDATEKEISKVIK